MRSSGIRAVMRICACAFTLDDYDQTKKARNGSSGHIVLPLFASASFGASLQSHQPSIWWENRR